MNKLERVAAKSQQMKTGAEEQLARSLEQRNSNRGIHFINEELTWDSAKEILKNKIILLERNISSGLAVGFELDC